MSGLTDRQRDVVIAVHDLTARHGYAPSYREIAAEIGWSSVATVAEYVSDLRSAGIVLTTPGTTRSIRLTPFIAVSRDGRIATIHPVRARTAPADCAAEAALSATDCEGVDAMTSISHPARRPLLLNPGDIITRNPNTGMAGSWIVALPPAQEGDQVWITHRDMSTDYPGVFVVGRDTELEVADGERAAKVAGLRALADYLEAHPDLPTGSLKFRYYPGRADGFEDEAAKVAEVDRVAGILGVEAGPQYEGDPHHYATRQFGSVSYEAVVCDVYDVEPAEAVTPEAAS